MAELVTVPMAESEAAHQQITDDVLQMYGVSNDSSVREFLKQHRAIPQLLLEAAPRLREHFGEATVCLRAFAL